jgi:hypothetical protein
MFSLIERMKSFERCAPFWPNNVMPNLTGCIAAERAGLGLQTGNDERGAELANTPTNGLLQATARLRCSISDAPVAPCVNSDLREH